MKWFLSMLACAILIIGVVTGMIIGMNALVDYSTPGLHKGDPYSIEEIWLPPIKNKVRCKYVSLGRRTLSNCPVVHEGYKTKNYNEFQWPAQYLEQGDVLGYMFKVGERSVEVWNVKDKSSEEIPNGACFKADPMCFWPSKNRCTKWREEKGVALCSEYPPVTALDLHLVEKE